MRKMIPVLLVLSACLLEDVVKSDDSAVENDDTATEVTDDTTGPPPTYVTDSGAQTGGTEPPPPAPSVLNYTHPCIGYRTDTLWFDDHDTAFVGCGTTVPGYGFYMTEDGGQTWDTPDTDLSFSNFRVSSITRSSDGLLYVAGLENSGAWPFSGVQAVSIDTNTSPWHVEPVFQTTGVISDSFHVGTYLRADDGRAVAESLTGTSVMHRSSDIAPWFDATYPTSWSSDGTNYQILDMKYFDGGFYGAGSTIAQPHVIFLPTPGEDGSRLEQTTINLGSYGELWGVDVDASGVIAGGVDELDNVGMVYWSGADMYAVEDYSSLDITNVVGAGPHWIKGVCRNGGDMVAVGEFSQRSQGFILRSTDGGATWLNVTPNTISNMPPVHRCKVFDDGELVVTGADGIFLRMLPPM